MTSSSGLLGKLVAILQAYPLCEEVEVVETKMFSPEQFFFKIRTVFSNHYNFQVRIYYNRGHIDYAYQLFTRYPVLRWDNKEEFPELNTYPHHRHDDQGHVKPSPLTGNPDKDLEVVLSEIEKFIHSQSKAIKS